MNEVVKWLNQGIINSGLNSNNEINFEYRSDSYVDRIYFIGVCVYDSELDCMDEDVDAANLLNHAYETALNNSYDIARQSILALNCMLAKE